jgi:leader peptidase (prepilin peptidase)/N-methyltransferase
MSTFFQVLETNPGLFLASVAVLGLMVGSFLNVVIHRLPIMLERAWQRECRAVLGQEEPDRPEEAYNLVVPGSRCPQCARPIGPRENIPLLSYLLLRGRCSGCGAAIPLRYPAVEALTAAVSLAVAWKFGVSGQTLAALLLSWSLISLTFIDLRVQLLPDAITLPMIWVGLFASLFNLFTDSASSILGGIFGYLSLWSVYQLFKLLTGKEGMGYGDFKLLALLGAWLGWVKLPAVVLLSSLVGAVIGIGMILVRKHDHRIPIPFGPYLAIAGWIALMWGDDINLAYFRLVGL